MKEENYIGKKLQFPDGEKATVIKSNFYKDEEDSNGLYDAIEVIFTIDGDEEEQEFNEMLDSREGYRFNTMKPI